MSIMSKTLTNGWLPWHPPPWLNGVAVEKFCLWAFRIVALVILSLVGKGLIATGDQRWMPRGEETLYRQEHARWGYEQLDRVNAALAENTAVNKELARVVHQLAERLARMEGYSGRPDWERHPLRSLDQP